MFLCLKIFTLKQHFCFEVVNASNKLFNQVWLPARVFFFDICVSSFLKGVVLLHGNEYIDRLFNLSKVI